MSASQNGSPLVRSYLTLRKAVGYLGIVLPVVLVLGDVLLGSGAGVRESISAYYESIMRGVFVGILFSVGIFLYSYKGYRPEEDRKALEILSDNAAGNLACVFALLVALFPGTSDDRFVAAVHFVAAALLFIVLAYFSLVLFTKTDSRQTRDSYKVHADRVYRTCGVVMIACIALVGLYKWLFADTGLAGWKPVFWLEAFALWAFGVSWFTKGRALYDWRRAMHWARKAIGGDGGAGD